MTAFSLDLRGRVLADCQAGLTYAAIARKYTVPAEWVRIFYKRFRETGEIAARSHATKRQPCHVRHAAELRAAAAEPDRTLGQLRQHPGGRVSIGALWRALRALKISLKKSRPGPPSGIAPDVAARRTAWRAWQVGLDPGRLVLLDETWAESNMTPAYGWGPVGQRIVEPVPHGHWTTITFLAALRSAGRVAPLVIDGAMNGQRFRAYVRQHLAKELRPGDLVVMGDLPSHKVAGVAEAIRGAGAEVVYPPPYSPALNPIEQVSSKAKAEVRRQKPRTVAATEQLCGEAADWLAADECRRYIRHAGYGSQGSG